MTVSQGHAVAEPIIKPGPKLFEFVSYEDWANRAQDLFRRYRMDTRTALCVDQRGRICTCGKDFAQARDEEAYPVVVYAVRELEELL